MGRPLIAAAVLGAVLLSGEATRAESCTLSQLMAERAGIRESTAAFTQERRVRYVREPLYSAGRLRFLAPDRLEMIVVTPRPETYAYEDGVLTVDRADDAGEIQVPVGSDLLLSAIFTGLVGTLSGDEAALKRAFHVDFDDDACRWWMVLVPKSKRLLEKIEDITLSGRDGQIAQVEIRQTNGDRSVLSISEQP